MWMLRATGDPNRRIRIEIDPITGEEVIRPASTFHFPACRPCNESYGWKRRPRRQWKRFLPGKSLQARSAIGFWIGWTRSGSGFWLAYNTLHKELFQPKFRIDQRLGKKDRIAIISVDPHDDFKGFGFGGIDNNIFRTSQAGVP
jgi:hypothetical protein